jgi:hypothetical protein
LNPAAALVYQNKPPVSKKLFDLCAFNFKENEQNQFKKAGRSDHQQFQINSHRFTQPFIRCTKRAPWGADF